jgi:hypothetical protein
METVSTEDSLLSAVEVVTLHGVPSNWQLKVKSLANPSLSPAEAFDFKPEPADSIWMVAKKKAGAPRWNFDFRDRQRLRETRLG